MTLIKLLAAFCSTGEGSYVMIESSSDRGFSGSSSSSGLSLRKKKMRIPTKMPKNPVTKKFQNQDSPEF
jgi:hypothetical protein